MCPSTAPTVVSTPGPTTVIIHSMRYKWDKAYRTVEMGEELVQLAWLETAQADGVPEPAGDLATQLVAAFWGKADPAFGQVEEYGKEFPGSRVPQPSHIDILVPTQRGDPPTVPAERGPNDPGSGE